VYVYFGFRIIVTCIVPFVALAILNSLIYLSVKRRRDILGKCNQNKVLAAQFRVAR
jgi:hypothetical protein